MAEQKFIARLRCVNSITREPYLSEIIVYGATAGDAARMLNPGSGTLVELVPMTEAELRERHDLAAREIEDEYSRLYHADGRCRHAETREVEGTTRGFSGSVAVAPYTSENPAAHGCVTCQEECAECGARRSLNVNQRHVEYGPWSAATRRRAAGRYI